MDRIATFGQGLCDLKHYALEVLKHWKSKVIKNYM